MQKNMYVIGIIFLFIALSVTPAVFGYSVELIDDNETLSSSSLDGGLMDSAWPMYGHDIRHTGRSSFGKSGNWFIEKWKFWWEGMIFSSPAIDKDGTIYIGSTKDHCLYAIKPDGTEKWRFKTNGHLRSSPSLSEDETIYVGSEEGYLYAIYPNGTKKWSIEVGHGWVHSSPVIDEDGIIYATSVIGSNICAFYPNGTRKWDITLGGWVYCTPGIDENNGIVYIGCNDHFMYSIYKNNGTIKWKYRTEEVIGSAPTIDYDGTIYFGSNDGYLYAVYPNGTTKWKFLTKPNFGLTSSPAIAEDGSIIVGSHSGYIYSINPDDGTENWKFNTDTEVTASPAIDKYGIIYIGSWDGMFYALNPDGALRWKYKTLDEIFTSAAIGEDGTIYIGAHLISEPDFYSYLYALEPFYDEPPEKPDVDGPVNGKVSTDYPYTAVSSDPDGDMVSYLFDWGDETNSGWTEYVPSGSSVERSHRWSRIGTFVISVKAKDEYGMESDLGTLTVSMPRNKMVHKTLFYRLIERFPLIQRLLNLE